ncbi:MAG: nucleotide exchange factor GrpE [Catonella sp.]|uniref:nucleotide exchange factor GrpE n=1 Tax=Catonella sp. TaxID=2382125 RepID=UPI003F9ECD94
MKNHKEKKLHHEKEAEKVETEVVRDDEKVSKVTLDEKELNKVKGEREASKEEEYKKKIDDLNDRLMRQMAEFDNFRKRTEKEKSQMFDFGAKGIVEKLLPVIDNFERGLDSLSDEEKEGAFAQGIDKIYKQLMQCLTDAGVTAIEAIGKEFNPEIHNAVMHGEDDSFGQNIVSEELQKGYMYKESVVRPSMVKVVN